MTTWASLFSGGKDSSYALHRAVESGRDVGRLVTVHPPADSFMYHVPATRLASLAAGSVGIPLLEVEAGVDRDGGPAFAAGDVSDSTERGDRELEPLEAALEDLADDLVGSVEGELAGVTAGAVESEYQTSRLRGMCDRLGIELFAPLWREEPVALAESMLDAGFEIVMIQVAADGLDESWLGRTLDREALSELQALNEERGVHVLGEGGEYETLVTDGPHMDRPIELEYEVEWEGNRGSLQIHDAWLG